MKKKKALIFGITGQDGSYLAELLIKKKYFVYGVRRRSSSTNTSRIDHILCNQSIEMIYGDLVDGVSIYNIIKKVKPDEIYNLAAQSHVKVSFETPLYTADADGLGPLRILEAIRTINPKIKYYQASTSEMYGNVTNKIINNKTPFEPASPYAAAKLFAHNISEIYRKAFHIYSVNGILFNHESPRRGENFVTKKITIEFSRIAFNQSDILELGNINAIRDWGHAADYVQAMWRTMQLKKGGDYIVSTGLSCSVRQFCEKCLDYLGVKIVWKGKGLKEFAQVVENKGSFKNFKIGKKIIQINPIYYRPLDVNRLQGDYKETKKIINWKPSISLKFLIKDMMEHDLKVVQKNKLYYNKFY